MLLNRDTAEGIANGSITLVLRRWDVPRAKAGGTQRTSVGTIRIDAVTQFPGSHRVTAAQALAAGYTTAKTAQADLDRRPAKHTHAIEVSFLAPDERPELAADDRPGRRVSSLTAWARISGQGGGGLNPGCANATETQ